MCEISTSKLVCMYYVCMGSPWIPRQQFGASGPYELTYARVYIHTYVHRDDMQNFDIYTHMCVCMCSPWLPRQQFGASGPYTPWCWGLCIFFCPAPPVNVCMYVFISASIYVCIFILHRASIVQLLL